MKTIQNTTIAEFMAAWFEGNYKALGEHATREDFERIKMEYIDMAGLYASRDFDMTYNLLALENRLNIIHSFILAQRGYIDTIGIPNLETIDLLRRFNHKLIWNGDKDSFLMQLEKIELREVKTRSMLDNLEKQLTDYRGKETVVHKSQATERREFISMIIGLEKNGYKIDEEKTTVEKLATMVKRQREEYDMMMAERAQKQSAGN